MKFNEQINKTSKNEKLPSKEDNLNHLKNIEEVFELNPELASAVYETLGFDKKLSSKVQLIHKFAHVYNIMYGDKKIGNFELPLDLEGSSVLIGDVEIDEEYRGKGFGVETYKAAINLSPKPIESLIASPEANRVWESLVRQGIAEKTEDGYKTTKLSIALEQEQRAKEIYSEYLDTIFPESKIKDIIWHGTTNKKEVLDKNFDEKCNSKQYDYSHGAIFATSSIEDAETAGTGRGKYDVISLIVNIKNLGVSREGKIDKDKTDNLPFNSEKEINEIIKQSKENWENGGWKYKILSNNILQLIKPQEFKHHGIWNEKNELILDLSHNAGFIGQLREQDIELLKNSGLDGIIAVDENDSFGKQKVGDKSWYVIFESKNIHILGSKDDIDKFKEFIKIKK